MASAFARFPPRLQEAIVSRLGWTALRPVQELAAEAILDGLNAVVLAPTAGGKTEAAMFPVLAGLMSEPAEGVGAIYIAPIKALLNNQEDRLGIYAEMVGLRRFVWHGDSTAGDKRAFLKEPAELLMTTPESLEVMLLSPLVPAARLFAGLRTVIVDEIHAFAGTDRGAHLLSVLERLAALASRDVQRVGLSATVGNPGDILRWLAGTSCREGQVIDPPRPPSRRQIRVGLLPSMQDLAVATAALAAGRKSLFFCQTRALAETVAERLRGRGVDVFVHHSSVALEERRAAEDRFSRGSHACIVCTSTLELGIDVGDLDLVFQANAPGTVSSFLQRMGRTGRRTGQVANTTFLCEQEQAVLQAVAIVELAHAGWVEPVAVQTRCWPALAHQVLALALQEGAVSAERCWVQLSRVPDFSGIARAEFDRLIAHMLAAGFLFEAGGLLSLGERAERQFGRRNFMDLYAVFTSPVLYRVQTLAGRDLGSLDQAFVDRLAAGISSFLLAGRAWLVDAVLPAERIVRVREAPRGRQPSWGGFVPQFLSRDLCQAMRKIVIGTDVYPYLDEAALAAVEDWRQDLGDLLRRTPIGLRQDEAVIEVWTFAGGRINATLRLALQSAWNLRVSADNLALRIGSGERATPDLRAALRMMADPAWWENAAFRENLLAALPSYRLSKFQDALPPEWARELVAQHVLDVDAAQRFLSECQKG